MQEAVLLPDKHKPDLSSTRWLRVFFSMTRAVTAC